MKVLHSPTEHLREVATLSHSVHPISTTFMRTSVIHAIHPPQNEISSPQVQRIMVERNGYLYATLDLRLANCKALASLLSRLLYG